ncbi:lipoprotein [Pseudoalteromonas sp. SIMBA_153]
MSTVLLCALAGCGQSGPLCLPEQPAEQKQPTDIPNKQTPAEQHQEQ